MGIENFFTLQTGQSGQNQNGLTTKSGLNSGSDQSLNGLNFLDIILARVNALNSEEQPIAQNQAQSPNVFGTNTKAELGAGAHINAKAFSHSRLLNAAHLAPEQKVEIEAFLEDFTRESGITIADILSTDPEVQAEVESFIDATGLGADAAINQALELNQQAFDDTLIPSGQLTAPYDTDPEAKASLSLLELLQIDANAQPEQIAQISDKISALRSKVESILQKGEAAALTTNLTPEQITALQNAPKGEWPEALKDVEVILIALVQPQSNESGLTPESAQEITEIAGDDPALANVLMLLQPQIKNAQPAKPAIAENAATPIQGTANPLMGTQADLDADASLLDAEETAQGLKLGKGHEGANKDNALAHAASKNNIADKANTPPPFSSFISGGISGDLFGLPTDALGLYDDLATAQAATGSTSSAALTSTITQAPHASAAHPAAQMIAFNLKKGADNAQNQTMTLELDPPELGRVEVRMLFGKDKTMKAHVITEKPETYMMLQRDASTLERALENSGLSDGGLSFELAEQGFDFNGNNQRGGGHDQGGTGAGNAGDEMEIIETTLNWNIDPESGHVRYDIWA